MLQEERSERSRTAILDAALDLFSHRGYGATSMRDIAGKAGVSTGSVYHHFKDKEVDLPGAARAVPGHHPAAPTSRSTWRSMKGRSSTTSRVLADAAREVLVQWRAHVALFYVDAVEFDGRHIQRFYAELAARFEQFAETNRERLDSTPACATACRRRWRCCSRSGCSSTTSRSRSIFGVERQLGPATPAATRIIADILQHGMLRADAAAAAGR